MGFIRRLLAACLIIALAAAILLVVFKIFGPTADRWTAPSFGFP